MKKVQKNKTNNGIVTKSYLDIRLREALKAVDSVVQDAKNDMREEMRDQTAKVLQAVDTIVTRFDAAEKEHAAHGMHAYAYHR